MASIRAQLEKAVATPSLPVKRTLVRISDGNAHFSQLIEDLQKMGCAGLFDNPWNLKDPKMV